VRTKGSNAVRIIGGEWRSRVIRFPGTAGLRPTPDRVRERLFNWLGQDLTGKRCLDLFAGSGALGFEALSRGAAEVVMVESSRPALRCLRATAEQLGAGPRLRLVLDDALHFLASPARGFDLVFVDPPYASRLVPEVLERLPPALAAGAVVYVESASAFAPGPGWRVTRDGRAGAVHHRLMEWGDHDESSLSGDVRSADPRA
jgi:16S rRNA (guanine966-N2)-methyltransferase